MPVLDLVPVEYCRGGEGTVTNTTGYIFVVLTKKTLFNSYVSSLKCSILSMKCDIKKKLGRKEGVTSNFTATKNCARFKLSFFRKQK